MVYMVALIGNSVHLIEIGKVFSSHWVGFVKSSRFSV